MFTNKLYLLTSFPSPSFTYIMLKQGNVRQCNSSTSSEVKARRSRHRQLEDPEKKVIIQLYCCRYTRRKRSTSKANKISYNTHQKEKIAFKLFKPQRYESHYAFITRKQKKDNSRWFKSLFRTINQ